MTNLKNRLKTIEKEVFPKQEKEIIPLLTNAWIKNGKTYYKNRDGLEKEYIESEHREKPILSYFNSEKEAYPYN